MSGGSCAIGIDTVSLERMKEALRNERFVKRVFTEGEIAYSMSKREPHRHLAGRFAAKEALLKALSKGLLSGLEMTGIEVTNGPGNRPSLRLRPEARALLNGRAAHLSISYTKEYAFALVSIG